MFEDLEKLPPLPEQKKNPAREELLPAENEESAFKAIIEGLRRGIYTTEDYSLDNGGEMTRVKDPSGKILLNVESENFYRILNDWNVSKDAEAMFSKDEDKGHA